MQFKQVHIQICTIHKIFSYQKKEVELVTVGQVGTLKAKSSNKKLLI